MIEIPEILSENYEVFFKKDRVLFTQPDYDISVYPEGFLFDCEDRGAGATCFISLDTFLALANVQASMKRLFEAQK